jgi:hypothetical protein
MKNVLLIVFVTFLFSCNSKWDKEYITSKCNKEMKDKMKGNPLIGDDKMKSICDCMADKMIAKYKTESAANKDEAGASEIGRTCAMEAMMGSLPTGTTPAAK